MGKLKELAGCAHNLCQLVVGSGLEDSLDALGEFPDGGVVLDLLGRSATHGEAGELPGSIGAEAFGWFESRLLRLEIPQRALEEGIVELSYRTDRVPTERSRLLLFELEAKARIVAGGRQFCAEFNNVHWHKRLAARS